MAYDHMDYCKNMNMSENEVNENLNSVVTLQDDEDGTFDDLLINIVKSYPHLYDTSSRDYRDVIKKENSWVEISKILDMPRKFYFLIVNNVNNELTLIHQYVFILKLNQSISRLLNLYILYIFQLMFAVVDGLV